MALPLLVPPPFGAGRPRAEDRDMAESRVLADPLDFQFLTAELLAFVDGLGGNLIGNICVDRESF